MLDIKQKPQMEKPKILEVSRAPKEAGDLLRKRYESQQGGVRPSEKTPVQYAVDRVEAVSQNSMLLAGNVASRSLKRQRIAAKDQNVLGQEQAFDRNAHTGQGVFQVERGGQKLLSDHGSQRVQFGDSRAVVDAASIRKSPISVVQERGRRKAIEDIKQTGIKTQLAERNTHHATPIKQKAVNTKTGGILGRGASLGDRLMTPVAAAVKEARRAAQKRAQRQMLKQAVLQTKRAAQATVRHTIQVTKVAARAATAAAKAIIAMGGGTTLLAGVLLIGLIGIIAASPFGIFFSGENTGPEAVPVSAAVAEINHEFSAQMESIQSGGAYDNVVIHGAAADWPEVLAVFASKVAGVEGPEAMDVVTIDSTRIDKLKAVFWDMTSINHSVETIHSGGSSSGGNADGGVTTRILHITITAKTAKEMSVFYSFTPRQTSALDELLLERATLSELIGNLRIISADASEVLKRLPAGLSPERKAVIREACSLVGKINYFWGGKSLVIGWDSRWGQLYKVWAEGSSSTGTWRPYGLDCSGFVDWVFYQASGGKYVIGHGGGAADQHAYCTSIDWSEALPGDLVFYPGDTHVGVVGGRDENKNLLIIHCASGYNNVVITGIEGFTSIGRPEHFF